MDNYPLIRDAIVSKKIVTGTYQDHYREMCPHVLGLKNDRRQALFYQFGGTSSSGLDPDGSAKNWRCIPIDDLQDVVVTDGEWHTAPNHTRPQTCVDEIDVEVDF